MAYDDGMSPSFTISRRLVPEEDEWRSGLFGCFQDLKSCAWGTGLPCVLYSHTYARLRTSPSTAKRMPFCNSVCLGLTMFGICSGAGWRQRSEIRHRYRLAGSDCSDMWTHCCCAPCALCQEEREVRSREKERKVLDRGYMKSKEMLYGGGTPGNGMVGAAGNLDPPDWVELPAERIEK